MSKKVFLGMSGGVDSSVSAILLKEQGYDVTGIYMKNWSEDLPGMKCPWAEDLADAKRVAVSLDMDFEVWDFEREYREQVVDYMLAEFQRGRTPNPDVVCNELIKFRMFYDWAMARGADYIATGHYARTAGDNSPQLSARTAGNNSSSNSSHFSSCAPARPGDLLRAYDENKDQTYFLYRMSDTALARTLFPIGHLAKPAVKQLAAARGLDVAHKKESMGICFVGEVGIKDFLSNYLKTQPGEIREAETDAVLGFHDGAIFYTIGQRHGLYLGGGLPYYVVGKDLAANIVYVSRNLNHPGLWASTLPLTDLIWHNGRTLADVEVLSGQVSGAPEPAAAAQRHSEAAQPIGANPGAAASAPLLVRLRHRAPLIPVTLRGHELVFSAPVKRPAPGQSAVLYHGEICLGGGIIAE